MGSLQWVCLCGSWVVSTPGASAVCSLCSLMGSHAAGLLEQVSPLLQNFEIARKGLNCSQLLFSYFPSVSLEFSSPLVWLHGGTIRFNLTRVNVLGRVGCVGFCLFLLSNHFERCLTLCTTYLSFHLSLMTAAEALWRCLTCLQTIVSLLVAESDLFRVQKCDAVQGLLVMSQKPTSFFLSFKSLGLEM